MIPCIDRLLMGDNKGNPMPMLATDWSLAPDKMSLTLTLRQGVTFHDGSDFNAKAAKFNLEAVMAAKLSGTELWDSIDIIDNYTVRINLNNFQNTIYSTLAGMAGDMVSPTAYQKNGEEWMLWNPVGTGPFKFDSYEREVSIKYVKNENYWQEGKPYLDSIEMRYIADETAGSIALKAGDVDMMDFQNVNVGADMKERGGYDVVYIPDCAEGITPDGANPDSPFADQRVREAIEYAIDKEGLVKALGFGFYTVADLSALPAFAGYDPDIPARNYDPEKAKQLLAEAGYADGFKTQIVAPTDADKTYLSAVQTNLKAVGIDAELDIMEWLRYQQFMQDGWEGLARTPLNNFPNMNSILWSRHMSASNKLASMYRPEGLEDAIMESITSAEVDVELLKKVFKMEHDYAMTIPTIGYSIGLISLDTLHDHNFFQYGFQLWTPEDTYFSK
jgi:ABC-type transport system substrate-binding protein